MRPAESTVRATEREDLLAGDLGGGSSLHAAAQLLAEPADREQPVVDAQAEPEDRDDVDDGGVEVDEVREPEQRGEGARRSRRWPR